jgi:hypothetical protein
MSKIAFMFPGQGSFEAGMGREIAEAVPEAMAVFQAGSEASGLDLLHLCFDAPAEELLDTEVQQPALVATSLAIDAALRARGIVPDYVVGHSVGEFAALGAAEVDDGARRSRSCASAGSRWRRREGAARLDGGDPRPRRRGRRGALPQDRGRVAGELQLPGPARRLRRDARGRRVLHEAEREGARRAISCASPARSTRRSSRARPTGCGRRSTASASGAARAFMSTVTREARGRAALRSCSSSS